MLGFTAIELGGLLLIGYLVVFGIVNRICKCIEHCATGRAIRATAANGLSNIDISKLGEALAKVDRKAGDMSNGKEAANVEKDNQ